MSDSAVIETQDRDGSVRVLQITDTHLFAQPDRTLLGINTRDSFNAVLEAIVAEDRYVDFVLVTGDISQDYSPESYQYFASRVACLHKKVFFLPGNHDDGPLMYRMLSPLGVNTERHIIAGRWHFVCLNSQVYGVPHGWIEHSQMDYLVKACSEESQLFTTVCVHHLPRLVGSTWLDTQTMHNQDDFNRLLHTLPNIRLVLSGHVHQNFDLTHAGLRYIATPSTSIQFLPQSTEFMLDTCSPGWRYLTFKTDGTVDTELHRLREGSFLPDLNSRGY